MLDGDSIGDVLAGGLLTTTKTVENFPGFPDGYELTNNFKEQSLRFGTEIRSETVTRITKDNDSGNKRKYVYNKSGGHSNWFYSENIICSGL